MNLEADMEELDREYLERTSRVKPLNAKFIAAGIYKA
jgi:hypothetical protein